MNHCPAEEVLLDYVAGRLDAAQTARFEQHAGGCAHCRTFCTEQRTVWRDLDRWQPAAVSEGFNRELWRRIDAEDGTDSGSLAGAFGFGLWKRVAPLAFALIVVVAAFVFDHADKRTERKPADAATVVVTATDADQLESTLDDIQLLHEADTDAAPAKPLPAARKAL